MFFNLGFQLSGLDWFSDYRNREKIWYQRIVVLLREKSASKGGGGVRKKSAKNWLFSFDGFPKYFIKTFKLLFIDNGFYVKHDKGQLLKAKV